MGGERGKKVVIVKCCTEVDSKRWSEPLRGDKAGQTLRRAEFGKQYTAFRFFRIWVEERHD
jgi:hypothetical protein